jgi:hypothetical protein
MITERSVDAVAAMASRDANGSWLGVCLAGIILTESPSTNESRLLRRVLRLPAKGFNAAMFVGVARRVALPETLIGDLRSIIRDDDQ